ncbi:hypothetical protein PENTCL1PPCAC_13133, partial [Pristionchus entomophagus]
NTLLFRQSMTVMKASFDENVQHKSRLEAEKRSLEQTVAWYEASWNGSTGNWNGYIGSFSTHTPWTGGAATTNTVRTAPPPPPPSSFPIHQSPLYVPPGTVFNKPPPTSNGTP